MLGCRYGVVAGRQADETVYAAGIADRRLRNAGVGVDQGDRCTRNNGSFRILHGSLDVAIELRVTAGC